MQERLRKRQEAANLRKQIADNKEKLRALRGVKEKK